MTSHYHDALANLAAARQVHARFFEQNRVAHERYIDLENAIGTSRATSEMPVEADIVKRIYESLAKLTQFPDLVFEALTRDLIDRIGEIAAIPEPQELSVVGRLRHDLLQLNEFRLNDLDKVNSRFWDVCRSGEIFLPREKKRLAAKLVREWCKVREVSLKSVASAIITLGQLPKASINGVEFDAAACFDEGAAHYPFDLDKDMAEAATWTELNGTEIHAMLERKESTGRYLAGPGPRF